MAAIRSTFRQADHSPPENAVAYNHQLAIVGTQILKIQSLESNYSSYLLQFQKNLAADAICVPFYYASDAAAVQRRCKWKNL
jgi:hypothetical protein